MFVRGKIEVIKLPARELVGASLGIEMVLSLVIMGAAGVWLDRRFGTEPTFLMLGVVLGSASGFWQMYRYAMRMERLDQRPPEKDPPPQ